MTNVPTTLRIVNSSVTNPGREYPSVDAAQTEFDRLKANLVETRKYGSQAEVGQAVWPTRRAELRFTMRAFSVAEK